MAAIAYLSVRFGGRLVGVVYCAYFLLALGAQALAAHASPAIGTAANGVATVAYAAVVVLLYGVFLAENPTRSGIAALFGCAGCAVTILALLHALPVRVSPLWCFGPYCALIGGLIVTSRFVPRALGALMIVAGIGWVAFAAGLLPPAASTGAEALGIVAEGALMLWLLVRGVDMTRWRARVAHASDGVSSAPEDETT